MNKKGEFTMLQVAGTILAVAVVIFLFYLAAIIFVPMFNKGDETAKSYFENLENEIKVADKGGNGEFFIWNFGDITKKDNEYYIVYFGDVIGVDFSKKVTIRVKDSGGAFFRGMTSAAENVFKFSPFLGGPAIEIATDYWVKEVVMNFEFNSLGRNSNHICICYIKGTAIFRENGIPSGDEPIRCDYCENLYHPVEFVGKSSQDGTWVDEGGETISIKLEGDKYVFTKI